LNGGRLGLVDPPDREARERRIAAALFFATCASVFLVYLLRWQDAPVLDVDAAAGSNALVFTVALMSILLAHELGHYAAGRAHGVRLALPWFLPAPVLVGTFGAIIRWADVPRSRSALLEMAAAGPLAGLVAVGLTFAVWLFVGPTAHDPGAVELSRPLLWWILGGLVALGEPAPPTTGDPLAFAVWIGCLVTAINLVPIGSLDGGHVVSALAPGRARVVGRVATVSLLALGLLWPGWAIWAAIANLLGPGGDVRATPVAEGRSRAVGAACLVAFVLCATPVPVTARP
jgi:membrane-associated protease RseP (regulator of RpoE activity)